MKLRHKLSLSFSTAGIIVLLLLGVVVYFFSANHRKQEFYNRLSQRVNITEMMFLEKDNFTDDEFAKIKDQFLHTLPEEIEDVIEISPQTLENEQATYPDIFLEQLLADGIAYLEEENRQGVGKFFHLNGGDYAVIVTAIDKEGIEMLSYIRGIIIITLITSMVMFSLLSIQLSARIIKPLTYKIRMANNISANNLHQRLAGLTSKDEMGELAKAFNKLLDRLESAFEAKKAFISNASHEIRNPLTAIMNEADISLEKTRSGNEYRESLSSICTEAERMKLLVDNLLELSKINYDETPIQFEYLGIIPLVTETIDKYQFSDQKNNIIVSIPKQINTTNLGIWGNKNLMDSALINVIDNALKFSSDQQAKVDISIEKEYIAIAVKDNGIGIPKEDLTKVTEPFYRSSNARNIKGSGIGMTLVNRIVEIHRGKLSISSILDEGTEVKVVLPLEKHLTS